MLFTAQQIGFEPFRTGLIVIVVLLSIKPTLSFHQYQDLSHHYPRPVCISPQLDFQLSVCYTADDLPEAGFYKYFFWQQSPLPDGLYSPGRRDETITANPLPTEQTLPKTNNGFVLVENESEILLDFSSNSFQSTWHSFPRTDYWQNSPEINRTAICRKL